MNSNKHGAYCREHKDEFRDELREEAAQVLSNWPGKSAAALLAISSVLTYITRSAADSPFSIASLFAYAVPILLIFLFPMASLLFSTLEKYSRLVLDLVCFTSLLGFCITLLCIYRSVTVPGEEDEIFFGPAGQINFVLLMTTAFSYHTRYFVTLLRNILFTCVMVLCLFLIDEEYLLNNIMQVVQGFLAGTIFSWLFFARVQTRFYYKSTDADTRQHLYNQLSKLVYPHQLEMIKSGDELENTMPVEKGRAIINVFDVQRSSEIRHERVQAFFVDIFRSFSQICMQDYQHNPLSSRAFRLKETGDGFISAIGYPFLVKGQDSLADHAIETALLMFKAFNAEVARFDYAVPIKAAMGLAFNTVQGTFQSSDIKSYDLYGEALIQADRYEEMRKHPQAERLIREHASRLGLHYYNILIIQDLIYNSLRPDYKTLFHAIDLEEVDHQIRQDKTARYVYFHVLP